MPASERPLSPGRRDDLLARTLRRADEIQEARRRRHVTMLALPVLVLVLTAGVATILVARSTPPGRPRSSSTALSPPRTAPSTTPPRHRATAPWSHFDPVSFTSVSLREWWVLGSVVCHGSKICPVILKTTDGGHAFERVPAPPAPLSAGNGTLGTNPGISELRFADSLHGWAYGPQLWATADGGKNWVRQAVPGAVTDVEAARGETYALSCEPTSGSCPNMRLYQSPIGSDTWQAVRLPARLSFGATMAVAGTSVSVMTGVSDHGNTASELLVSSNQGRSFAVHQSPCFPGLGGRAYPAIDVPSVLWAACPTGMMAAADISSNDGSTWQVARGRQEFSNGLSFAPVSGATALAWPAPPSGGLALTIDGGRTYRTVFRGITGSTLLWAGYSDSSRAYLIDATNPSPSNHNELWESANSGRSWTRVHFAP
ncbi:MAG: hypothetical protein ACYCSF_01315 [Acidimicrobiales bacterium]